MEHNKPIQRTAYQLTLSRGQSREKREQGRKYHSPVLGNRICLHVRDYYHDVSDKVVFLRGSDFEAIFHTKIICAVLVYNGCFTLFLCIL